MDKKHLTTWLITISILAVAALRPPALTAGQDGFPPTDGNIAADIFSSVAPTETMHSSETDAAPVSLAPALLFIGIVLLTAAGRQYAGQYRQAHALLRDIQQGMEGLIDESVTIEGGQYDELHRQLDGLRQRKAAIAKELQSIQGVTS